MPPTKPRKKIVWALDAFVPEKEASDHLGPVLGLLAEKLNATIVPTYVLSPDQLNLTLDFSGPWIKHYKPAVEKSVRQIVERIRVPNLGDPKIIVKDSPSLTSTVKALCAFAAAQSASVIVTGSQGRQGISRLVLGSFAESLLLYSKVPVLVVGSHSHSPAGVRKVLFPTDLSKGSIAAFHTFVDTAQALECQVTLLHAILNPIEPVLQSGVYLLGGGWIPVPIYLEKEREKREKIVNDLAARARKKGLTVTVKVDATAKSVTQSIFDHAQAEQADWIAMAAESGPVASALLGSITRQVVRNAPCPVWVYRSRPKKK